MGSGCLWGKCLGWYFRESWSAGCVCGGGGGKSTMWQAAEALSKVEGAIILQPLVQGAFR